MTDVEGNPYYFTADNFNRYVFGDPQSQSYRTFTLPRYAPTTRHVVGQNYLDYESVRNTLTLKANSTFDYTAICKKCEKVDAEHAWFSKVKIPGTDKILVVHNVEYFHYVIDKCEWAGTLSGFIHDDGSGSDDERILNLKAQLQHRSVSSFEGWRCRMLNRIFMSKYNLGDNKMNYVCSAYYRTVFRLPEPCQKVAFAIYRLTPRSTLGKVGVAMSAGAALYAITHRNSIAHAVSMIIASKGFLGRSLSMPSMLQPLASRVTQWYDTARHAMPC